MPGRIPYHRPAHLGPPGEQRRAQHRRYNAQGRDPVQAQLYGCVAWQRFRARIRAERVLCEQCRAEGRTVIGQEVHHLVDPRQDPTAFLDPERVKLLCKPCHSRITSTSRGKACD